MLTHIQRYKIYSFIILIFLGSSIAFSQTSKKLSDAEIKQIIIQNSISNYSGNCPCPYNRTKNGSKCGKRSAYSKPRGKSPYCYESDISKKQVSTYRKN